MGSPIEYGDAREILKEIRSLIPGYGLLGPTPQPPKVDAETLNRYLTEGFAEDLSDRYSESHPASLTTGTFTLAFVQTLFHSGKLSTRSKGLLLIQSEPFVTLNSADAAQLGLEEGSRVKISNSRASVITTVKVRDRVPAAVVWFPEHFDGEAKQLADWAIDPRTQIPYFKLAQVSLAKVS
jgi:formate dehydrogenase alpha subunit